MFFKKFAYKKIINKLSSKYNQQETTDKELSGCRVAILATDGFEQVELFEPRRALMEAGASVVVVAPKRGKIKAWQKDDWGKSIEVDLSLGQAFNEDFDFLLLPGGVLSPDQLRQNNEAIDFVKTFVNSRKTIAAICHGPQLLIESGMVKGRSMTSYPSIKTDLINAGAQWEDKEVVVSHGLITSRSPADLRAFNHRMIKEFSLHRRQAALPNTEGYVVTM